jgi:hypothetical protein
MVAFDRRNGSSHAPSALARQLLVAVLVVAYLMTGGATDGGVLCFEPDGRVVVEIDHLCNEGALSTDLLPEAGTLSDRSPDLAPERSADCKCFDIPLPTVSVGKPSDGGGARKAPRSVTAAIAVGISPAPRARGCSAHVGRFERSPVFVGGIAPLRC